MKFRNCDQYLSIALNEAKKSMMTHMHGCVAIDNKTGQILSRGFNDWCSWSDMPCSRRAPSEWQWQQRQKEECQESPC
jgi:hypothetical protein